MPRRIPFFLAEDLIADERCKVLDLSTYLIAMTDKRPPYSERRRGHKHFVCHCCRQELPFCWSCPCGFQICPSCFTENKWGLTNGPTWVCPDCGRIRMM